MGIRLSYRIIVGSIMLLTALVQANAQENIQELEASRVVATPPALRTRGDTLIVSPEAFMLEQDAVLEDFLKLIPGLEFDGNEVTLYGRKISRLLVNGRLYFGGDVLTGLRNIQARGVESVRSYDRQSDLARMSGIDDGEEEQVLDVTIKKSFLDAWKGSIQAGGGIPGRYRSALSASKMDKDSQLSIVGNLSNTAKGQTVSGGSLSRLGLGSAGDNQTREAGIDYSGKKGKAEISANISYTGSSTFRERETESRTIHSSGTSFYDIAETARIDNNKITSDNTFEWKPNKKLTLLLKPKISFSTSGSWRQPYTEAFNVYPTTDASPLHNIHQTLASEQRQVSGGVSLVLTRRFAKRGRSVTARLSGSFTLGDYHYFNDYLASYSKKQTVRKQYFQRPWSDTDLLLQGAYNEPLTKNLYLQFILNARWITHGMKRDFYSMEGLAPDWAPLESTSAGKQIQALPEGYRDCLNPELSAEGLYNGFLFAAIGNLRYVRKKFNLTAGISVRPVISHVEKTTFDIYPAPYITLRYNPSKNEQLGFTYRSFITTPRPVNLMNVNSGTNPLYVRTGNPDLKPAFNQQLKLNYTLSVPSKGHSLVCEVVAKKTDNAFTTSTEYIPETGGRISRSCNIDGNYSAEGNFNFHHDFKGTPYSIGNLLSGAFFCEKNYLYNTKLKADEVNTLLRGRLKEQLTFTAHWNRIYLSLKAAVLWAPGKSLLRPDFHESPYSFREGMEATFKLPWSIRLSTEITLIQNRGYTYEILNRDPLYWNASLSKNFLRGKATVKLEASHIPPSDTWNLLHRFAGMSMSAGKYTGTNQYVLASLSYRF